MAARGGIGLVGRFLGSAVSEAAAFAAGVALGPVLGPPVQAIRNEVNSQYPFVPPDAGVLAEGVAQGQVDETQAREWASWQGIGDDAFTALRQIADTGPGIGSAFTLWRRGLITTAGFRRAVKRGAVEDEWIDALVGLHDVLLSPAELANAVVQGHRSFDAAAVDADKQGISLANFQTMVDNTGLPPGPETLLDWERRGIINDSELAQGIREGHTKFKYIDKYRQALHPVLSHTTYAGLRLRGWITPQESYAGGALTGYTQEQMDQEFLNRGRPATTHQVHIGYARGGRLEGANLSERETFARAVKNSDIRPEYEPILWAQRYTYPSAFVLRALVSNGDITRDDGEQILLFSGWEPTLAAKVADSWAHPSTSTSVNPRVKRAQDMVYNGTHRSYMDNEIDRDRAITTLERIGLTAVLAGQVVDLWEVENEVLVKPLTAAQIKKAYSGGEITVDDAVSRLVKQQWTTADANLYLTT